MLHLCRIGACLYLLIGLCLILIRGIALQAPSPARQDWTLEGCLLPCWQNPPGAMTLYSHLQALRPHYPRLHDFLRTYWGEAGPAQEIEPYRMLTLGTQARLRVGDLLLLYGTPDRALVERWSVDALTLRLYFVQAGVEGRIVIPANRVNLSPQDGVAFLLFTAPNPDLPPYPVGSPQWQGFVMIRAYSLPRRGS